MDRVCFVEFSHSTVRIRHLCALCVNVLLPIFTVNVFLRLIDHEPYCCGGIYGSVSFATCLHSHIEFSDIPACMSFFQFVCLDTFYLS